MTARALLVERSTRRAPLSLPKSPKPSCRLSSSSSSSSCKQPELLTVLGMVMERCHAWEDARNVNAGMIAEAGVPAGVLNAPVAGGPCHQRFERCTPPAHSAPYPAIRTPCSAATAAPVAALVPPTEPDSKSKKTPMTARQHSVT